MARPTAFDAMMTGLHLQRRDLRLPLAATTAILADLGIEAPSYKPDEPTAGYDGEHLFGLLHGCHVHATYRQQESGLWLARWLKSSPAVDGGSAAAFARTAWSGSRRRGSSSSR